MAVISPPPKLQFLSAGGVPISGGLVYTYVAGTTTPATTYTDAGGATANSNPVELDSRGEASIWLGGAAYKFTLADAVGDTIYTVDYISGGISSVSPQLTGNVRIDTDSPDPALKITQIGTGAVFIAGDSADPDATPFIIDADGKVGIGVTAPTSKLDIGTGVMTGGWAYLPAGTAMLFIQTAAPTGWTKSFAYDDRALRITTGSVGVGGLLGFTTAMAPRSVTGTVGDTALSAAQMPAHTHDMTTDYQILGGGATAVNANYINPKIGAGTTFTTTSNGSGATHTHSFSSPGLDMRVAYVDAIIAVKD